MRIRSIIVVLFFAVNIIFVFAEDAPEKIRLSGEINNYQPSILPVTSLDGKKLYFDRKRHPENIGSFHDDDDIWMSTKTDFGAWTDPVNLRLYNTSGSNVLFTLMPDGKTALVYNEYLEESNKITKKYGLLNFESAYLTPFLIEYYKNDSKNFYGYLSHDRQYLLLSLENNDSKGGLDIFLSIKEDDGLYSKPVNLSVLNTASTEVGFYLAYDNKTLYFATDGRDDTSNLDLYMTRRLDESWQNWSEPVSLGSNFNSKFDETSIWLSSKADTAYIASGDTLRDRRGIYTIQLSKDLKPASYTILSGKVSSNQKNFLNGSILIKGNNRTSNIDFTSGEYVVVLSDPGDYKIVFTSPGMKDTEINYYAGDEIEWVKKEITLEPQSENIVESVSLYFNTSEFELNSQSREELYELYNNWKGQSLLIEGFADPRGDSLYNYNLSLKRAESVKNYLLSIGFSGNNIHINPRGESNANSNEYHLYRRVTITVLNKDQVEKAD